MTLWYRIKRVFFVYGSVLLLWAFVYAIHHVSLTRIVLTTLVIYTYVAIALYFDEHPTEWYCRLRWNTSRRPTYRKMVLTKKQTIIAVLCWPLTLISAVVICLMTDILTILTWMWDKIKGLFK